MITIHAALEIAENQHITIFYNDRCSSDILNIIIEHLQSIPINRKVKITEFIELDNHKDHNQPLIGAKLVIMNEKGDHIDNELMLKISNFSDKFSYRSNIEKQFIFTMHTTFGLKSEVDLSKYKEEEEETINYIISKRYIKNHSSGEKFYI